MRVKYIGETKHQVDIEPSCTFELKWIVCNSGKEEWEDGVKFVKVSKKKESKKPKPTLIGGMDDLVVAALKPGEQQEIAFSLTTPAEGKQCKTQWMLVTKEGERFGRRVSAKVFMAGDKEKVGRRAKRQRKEIDTKKEKEDVEMGAESADVPEGSKAKRRRTEKPTKENKDKKDKTPLYPLLEEWPENTTHLFLDGNNMLFVASSIRSMVLHRAKGKAELAIEKLALAFLEKVFVPSSTLVYDSTKTYREHVIKAKNVDTDTDTDGDVNVDVGDGKVGKLTVCSASRTHKISDDAIVQWVSDLKDVTTSKLVVTSDRELVRRVQEQGGCVMKPGRWIKLAASKISNENVEELDTFMDSWLDQQTF